MNRKICIVTGTRAEFGLLRCLMELTKGHPTLTLQIIATGMHLSPDFGSTYKEIEDSGFKIDAKVEMLLSGDTSSAVTKSMGLGMIGFSDAFERLSPDILVVLGDRFEIFSATSAAMIANIPVAHLHGGETTEGAFDEAIRHSISKMSHLHFVAAKEYRQRVIQLGEHPERVFDVGGMGVDAIKRIKLMSTEELQTALGIKLGVRNLLITFHPVTLESRDSSIAHMKELLKALSRLQDTTLIFTMPNADSGRGELGNLVTDYVDSHPNASVYKSLGQYRYLSCLAHVDGVVGNSSSGLLEAPSFKIGTINIGDRQKGRLRAQSVIDCEPISESIITGLKTLYSAEFQDNLKVVQSPYGEGNSSEFIVKVLSECNLQDICKKEFYDLHPHIEDKNLGDTC